MDQVASAPVETTVNEFAMKVALGLLPLLNSDVLKNGINLNMDMRPLFYRISCASVLCLQGPSTALLSSLRACLEVFGCNVETHLDRHSICCFFKAKISNKKHALSFRCVLLFMELVLQHLCQNAYALTELVLAQPLVIAGCYEALGMQQAALSPQSSLGHYYTTLSRSILERQRHLAKSDIKKEGSDPSLLPGSTGNGVASDTISSFLEWHNLLLSVWIGQGLFTQLVSVAYSTAYCFPGISLLVVSERYSFNPTYMTREPEIYRAYDALHEMSKVARQLLRLSNVYDMSLPDFEAELFKPLDPVPVSSERSNPKALTPFANLNASVAAESSSSSSSATSMDIFKVPLTWIPSCMSRLVRRAHVLKWEDRKLLANFLNKVRPGRSVAALETELGNLNLLPVANGKQQHLHSNVAAYLGTYTRKTSEGATKSLADSTSSIRHCSLLIEAAQSRWRQKLKRVEGTRLGEAQTTDDIEDLLTKDLQNEAYCPIAYRMLDGNTVYSVDDTDHSLHADYTEIDSKMNRQFGAQVITACLASSKPINREQPTQQKELNVRVKAATPVSMWIAYGVSKLS
jgi:hypothetical protein